MSDISLVQMAAQPIVRIFNLHTFKTEYFAFTFTVINARAETLFVTIAARANHKRPGKYLFDVFFQREKQSRRIPVTLNDTI